jgi:hypothetical protein
MTDFPQSSTQQQTYPLFAAQNCKLLLSLKFLPMLVVLVTSAALLERDPSTRLNGMLDVPAST